VKKLLVSMVVVFGSFLLNTNAHALFYQFSGDANGGVASATMEVTITGNQLTIVINNTSPARTNDSLSLNSPAINGFGFNLGSLIKADGWLLSAYKSPSADFIPISGSATGTKGVWDYAPDKELDLNFMFTTGLNIQGYLLNPSARATVSGPYYTTASLSMTFKENIDGFTDPMISFANVGKGGEGNLTLTTAPEPGTMLLLGLGLIGIGIVMRELF